MKKGVSAVVATVLIILITVAAVSIIWVAILPMISENVEFNEELVDLTINTYGGYTFWDDVNKEACVQVKRGSDDAILEGIKVVFSIAGNSITGHFESDNIPGVNEAKKQCFSELSSKPESVKVIPVFADGEGVVTSEVLGSQVSKGTNDGDSIPVDDGGSSGAVCRDGNCDSGESSLNCCEDCGCPAGETCVDNVCVIEIGTCKNLNQTGKTYLLNQSISTTGTCFTVLADDITIDFNGKSIIGTAVAGYSSGVYINGYDRITIKNGQINSIRNAGVGGEYGIYMANSNNSNILNMSLSSNTYGIYISSGSNNSLIDNTVNFNWGDAFIFTSSSDNTITRNTANNNAGAGFSLGSNSNNNVLTGNTANSNFDAGGIGISIVGCSGNEINGHTACGNGARDFSCYSAIGTSGTGNKFGNGMVTVCDGWPINSTNYNYC